MKTAAGRYIEGWQRYIAMEWRLGNVGEARTLFKRCYSRRMEDGGQDVLCEAWLRFEREEGSAEDHLQACLKAEPILAELQAVAIAAADAQAAAQAHAAAARAPRAAAKEIKEPKRQQQQQQQQQQQKEGKKGPKGRGRDEGVAVDVLTPLAKKSKHLLSPAATQQPAEDEQPVATADEGTAVEPAATEEGMAGQAATQHMPPKVSTKKTKHTAFVKHLAPSVNEGTLQALFAPMGALNRVRLVIDHNTGQHKVGGSQVDGMDAALELTAHQSLNAGKLSPYHPVSSSGPHGICKLRIGAFALCYTGPCIY
jgi:hypothetical protein